MRRPWLTSLIPLYSAGLMTKSALLDAGVLKQRRLQRPVISIGSLSAGGAGKTPVVLMLARLLTERGFVVGILSRGYGRITKDVLPVELANDGLDAARFGDEPTEMAQAGLRVFVGSDRFAAGTLAESTSLQTIHLLDDGFQHRKLARDLDIVLLTRADIEDHLLPGGNLREPLSALKRAKIVVVREEEDLAGLAAASGAAVWVVRRRLRLPPDRPTRPLAFCGIARPESFFAMLREAGCPVVGREALPDHHIYDEDDLTRLVNLARASHANGFITTAKDAVKLDLARLAKVGPVAVARLEVELLDAETALEPVLRLLRTTS
ncbi:lipid-A-disaccharide kinase [Granulicella rosea]|uniref:Tetraacyldisaccharide 4'-kinase n=1 Tax=Granulicella rosea TaxID=474952 RepID=A0A239JNS8_9BACT|nr:tetraacyldisaccharide 4'-kinase [Granulicella rosea]SNT07088.1 lipid-A-disaccharide kinase [Granulicella rosea]